VVGCRSVLTRSTANDIVSDDRGLAVLGLPVFAPVFFTG